MKRTLLIGSIFLIGTSAHAYREIEGFEAGTVAGSVKLTKAAPAKAAKAVTQDAGACGKSQEDVSYKVGKDGAFANVVVFLDGIKKGKKIGSPTAEIDQRTCQYSPHISAFPVGTKLSILNSDTVLHNTHSYLGNQTLFNVALPNKGAKVPKDITEPGIIKFACDAGHTWMSAWAYVTDHPYVTVTDKDGKFSLSDVPAGEYTLKTWHEVEGEKTAKVTVAAGGTAKVEVAY